MFRFVVSGIALTLSLSAIADNKSFYFEQYQNRKAPKLLASTSPIESHTFDQFVDHNNMAKGMFKQRYYIDTTFSDKASDPIFFYICGEAVCRPSSLSSAIRGHAQKYHAKLVALEHRYYGKSLPTDTLSTEDLQYLSTEQAIADLAYFQKQMMKQSDWQGKWVSFGGSYPGSLSAYYRLKHPELVVGSLASSAPVKAKEDFFEYDKHVATVAGPACLPALQQAVQAVDNVYNNQAELDKIKAAFSAQNVTNNTDFMYVLADIAAIAVQYGTKPRFCELLTTSSTPLEGYVKYAHEVYNSWGIKPEDLTPQGAMSEDPNAYPDGLGMRAWYYQSCTEYGYWQNANPDRSLSARSATINLDYHRNICQRLFGIDSPVDTNKINQNYYEPLQNQANASNILFTNGSTDPWSNLSLTEDNDNTGNKNLSYYVIEGAAHCDDLRPAKASDSRYLRKARVMMERLTSRWLKKAST